MLFSNHRTNINSVLSAHIQYADNHVSQLGGYPLRLATVAVVGLVRLMSLAVFLQRLGKLLVAERYQFGEATLLVIPAVVYCVLVDFLCCLLYTSRCV